MSLTVDTAPGSGWYDDPSGAGAWRWWDGAVWTAHILEKDAALSAPAPTAPAMEPISLVPWETIDPVIAARVRELERRRATRLANGGRGPMTYWSHDRGSAQTVGVWLLATSPVVGLFISAIIAGAALTIARGTGGSALPWLAAGLPFLIVPLWIFAAVDSAQLTRRGYRRPRVAWMLLMPPLFYLRDRGEAVRAVGERAWPAELCFAICVVLVAAMGAYAVLTTLTLLAASGSGLLPFGDVGPEMAPFMPMPGQGS